jgi:hypothetical protein
MVAVPSTTIERRRPDRAVGGRFAFLVVAR